MILVKSVIQGNHRLSLNAIQKITFKPVQKIQLVLGTNGSGKSSWLSALLALAPSEKDYKKPGSWANEYYHAGNNYTLCCEFKQGGNRYSFKKNNQELNTGNTITVFNKCVESEFGLTSDIADLLTGVTSFSSMEISHRRKWFTKISDADYTYAISYYQKLKETHRDITGAIKQLQQKLVIEKEKCLTEPLAKQYREDIRVLKELVELFIESRPQPNNTQQQNNPQVLAKLLKSYQELISSIARIQTTSKSLFGYRSSDYTYLRQELYSEQILLEERRKEITQEILKIDESLHSLEEGKISDFKDIQTQLDTELQAKASIVQTLEWPDINIKDLAAALRIYDDTLERLERICSEIPTVDRDTYTRPKFDDAKVQYQLLSEQQLFIEADHKKLLGMNQQLDALKNSTPTECPNCSFRWIEKYDSAGHAAVKEKIINISVMSEDNLKRIKDLQLYIENSSNYFSLLHAYTQLRRASYLYDDFWSFIDSKEFINNDPKAIPQLFLRLKLDLTKRVKIAQLEDVIAKLFKLNEETHDEKDRSAASLHVRRELLEDKLHSVSKQIAHNAVEFRHCQNLIAKKTLFEALRREIQEELKSKEESTNRLILNAKRSTLNNLIVQAQVFITQREKILNEQDSQGRLIDSYASQIEKMQVDAELLKEALTALSPTEGLIAKGLTGFINRFTSEMNMFIKRIWLYPLEILKIEIGENLDLDYKFKVLVNSTHQVADISRGSSGMKEVIDLAFKVISMKYLNLEDFPLFLDEFGSKLDEAHRKTAHHAMRELMRASNFSQVFIVSHYEESYASLTDCDITVLSDANLNLPSNMGVNEVTFIE